MLQKTAGFSFGVKKNPLEPVKLLPKILRTTNCQTVYY